MQASIVILHIICFHLQDVYEKLMSRANPVVQFVRKICELLYNRLRFQDRLDRYYVVCDQVAMAVVLDDRVATETISCHADAELAGEYTRGQLVVDSRAEYLGALPANVDIVKDVSYELFLEQLFHGLGADMP